MSYLKSLTFTVSPQQITANPKLKRRQKFIERLEEQRQLAKDPNYAPVVRRWIKGVDGLRSPVDTHRRIAPWWRLDGNGSVVLVLKSGLRTLEVEKGKPAILVGTKDRLETVLGTLIAAAKAGELDSALETASTSELTVKRRAA